MTNTLFLIQIRQWLPDTLLIIKRLFTIHQHPKNSGFNPKVKTSTLNLFFKQITGTRKTENSFTSSSNYLQYFFQSVASWINHVTITSTGTGTVLFSKILRLRCFQIAQQALASTTTLFFLACLLPAAPNDSSHVDWTVLPLTRGQWPRVLVIFPQICIANWHSKNRW